MGTDGGSRERLLDALERAETALAKAQARVRVLETDRARRLATRVTVRLGRERPVAAGGMPQQIGTPLAEIDLAAGVEVERLAELIQEGSASIEEPGESGIGEPRASDGPGESRSTGKMPVPPDGLA